MWGIWEKIWVSSLFTAKFSFASCLCFYNCVAESFVVVVSPASSVSHPLFVHSSLTHLKFPPLKDIIVPNLDSSALHHYVRFTILSFHTE